MFDNEIDWVTRLECSRVRREACEAAQDPRAYTYKAEHKLRVEQDETQASVQVRRVSLGVAARTHVNAIVVALKANNWE